MKPSKRRYKTTNWSTYNRALQMRGDLTVWFSPDLAWHGNERAGKTGRPTSYRDSAIQTILTLKVLFSQALRQARGLLVSLVRQFKLNGNVPSYSTVSRRQAKLNVTIPVRGTQEPLHLLIDSTGLKFYGEGEWKVKQHGMEYRRGWRKVHLAIDRTTQERQAVEMTDQYQADSPQLPRLLAQLPATTILSSVTADGAYDKRRVYRCVHERGAELITPPCKNAQYWKEKTDWAKSRNNKLTAIKRLGRGIWKRWSGYHQRNLIETTMHRFKRLGERLHARQSAQQTAEVLYVAQFLTAGHISVCPLPCLAHDVNYGQGVLQANFELCNKADTHLHKTNGTSQMLANA